MWTSDEFLDRVEKAVAAAEMASNAEVVIVIARRSATYREIAAGFGAALATATLAFVLFSPLDFDPLVVPAVVVGIGAIGAVVLDQIDGAAWFVPRAWKLAEVRRAASAAFHEEVVHGTKHGTGVLLYLSLVERRVEVLPDLRLEARVPSAHWNELSFGDGHDLTTPEAFLTGLAHVATLLADRVPALNDNPNEIHDRPRLRL